MRRVNDNYDNKDTDDEADGVADRRDAARPICQDLSNWVTVDGELLTDHKKSEDGDEYELPWIQVWLGVSLVSQFTTKT